MGPARVVWNGIRGILGDFQDGRAGQGGGWGVVGSAAGSGGQEGGWVVRGDGLGAEGDEVSVVGGGEGVDGFGGGEGLLAESFGFAALYGVEDEDAVGEGATQALRREAVAAVGRRRILGEGGEEQETAGGERMVPGAGDAHVGVAAGGADYDGW